MAPGDVELMSRAELEARVQFLRELGGGLADHLRSAHRAGMDPAEIDRELAALHRTTAQLAGVAGELARRGDPVDSAWA